VFSQTLESAKIKFQIDSGGGIYKEKTFEEKELAT